MLSDLAFQLAASGSNVRVVTSRLQYDNPSVELSALEVINGVTIHRVWTSRFGRANTVGRLCDYLTFYMTAPIKVFSLVSRGDVVIAKTDPPMISVPVMLAAKLRGARRVNWLQDMFPEVASALGMNLGGSYPRRALTWLRNWSLKVANVNVVLGRRMHSLVERHAPRVPIRIVSNWSPTADIAPLPRAANPLRPKWQLENSFVVGYSGNLGRAHDLGIVLDAAEKLRNRPDVVFLIIGEGNQRAALVANVATRHLTNIVFRPYQQQDQLKFSLTLPDVHIVSLKPQLEGLIVPSKFYSSIAAGRAVLFIGAPDGEIARCLSDGECGFQFDAHDAVGLAGTIERLAGDREACEDLGKNARTLFEREYSREIALRKWREVIDEAAK
jgi:colanic acid biosynthesis glycosyl transferase WcaI